MSSSQGNIHPETFESMEEYKAILDNLAALSQRRQNTNNLYMGLNTVFLTAVGVFISTHVDLTTWSTAGVVALISLSILPLNFIWRASLTRYGRSLVIRYDYLSEIEEEFRARSGPESGRNIGLYSRLDKLGVPRFGNSQLERITATYFLCFYPALSLVLAILTAMTQNHLIGTFSSL